VIRVILPYHLQTLAGVGAEVQLQIDDPVTPKAIIDALESKYPMLTATIRESGSGRRRAFLRFFACREDISHQPLEQPLPEEIVSGKEPFRIVGAIAGG